MEGSSQQLRDAIRQLPTHTPGDAVWVEIVRELERTEAEAPLRRAIGRLPQYDPPGRVWSALDQEASLRETIDRLPTYEPSEMVWETIEEQLPGTVKTGITRFIYWRPLMAAASVLLLVWVGWNRWNAETNERISTHYHTEVRDETLLDEDWNTAERMFVEVVQEVEAKSFLAMNSTIRELRSELQTLNAAKTEVEAAMERLGRDAAMIRQLASIEQQRSDVLKRMAAFI